MISEKLLYNLFLSILISDIRGRDILTSQEQEAFLVFESYPLNSQSSSHKVRLLFTNSFFLSAKEMSVPFSEVEV